MDEKYSEKRLVCFKRECILAGPRNSILGFIKFLHTLGVSSSKGNAISLENKKGNAVLFLRNNGIRKSFPEVKVLTREWWDYYHNPKKHSTKYKTYNIPKQWKFVCENILILENKPFLIPE